MQFPSIAEKYIIEPALEWLGGKEDEYAKKRDFHKRIYSWLAPVCIILLCVSTVLLIMTEMYPPTSDAPEELRKAVDGATDVGWIFLMFTWIVFVIALVCRPPAPEWLSFSGLFLGLIYVILALVPSLAVLFPLNAFIYVGTAFLLTGTAEECSRVKYDIYRYHTDLICDLRESLKNLGVDGIKKVCNMYAIFEWYDTAKAAEYVMGNVLTILMRQVRQYYPCREIDIIMKSIQDGLLEYRGIGESGYYRWKLPIIHEAIRIIKESCT